MPIQLLQLGERTPVTNGTVYALPSRRCRVAVQGPATAQVSVDGVTWTTLTGAELLGGVEVASGFIKCSADTTVYCKSEQ